MSSSLYRLIALSKRTGDRLIVHNPSDGQDMVILPIDAYEALIDIVMGEDMAHATKNTSVSESLSPLDTTATDTVVPPSPYTEGVSEHTESDGWQTAGDILAEAYPTYMDSLEDDRQLFEEVKDFVDQFPVAAAKPSLKESDIPSYIPLKPSDMHIFEDGGLEGEDPVFLEEPVA